MDNEIYILAINDIKENEIVGNRPYEMVWAKRQEERKPLIDFEDLTGWIVEPLEGAVVELRRTKEQQMWGEYVAKVTCRGESPKSHFFVRPPQPVPIPDKFDCINIWMYGNRWLYEDSPDIPPVEVTIHFEDAIGKPYRVYMTHVQWKEWWLVHRRIPQDIFTTVEFPCFFTAIEFSNCSNKEDQVIFFDSLSFYTEEIKPLKFKLQPKRNLTLFEGQSPGLNTGHGKLDFPTREETILPSNYELKFENRLTIVSENKFEFVYSGSDGEVKYIFDASEGLSGIHAFSNGKKVCIPLWNGGVKFETPTDLKLQKVRVNKQGVSIVYSDGVEYRIQIMQKSLVIDAICRGGKATEFTFGQIKEAKQPELIYVPFLTLIYVPLIKSYPAKDPKILMSQTNSGQTVFTSMWIDWYRSNGSELFCAETCEKGNIRINGGVWYHKKTDGKRNDFFERIFLTVSPVFEEVLPTIANPQGIHAKQAAEYLWQETGGPEDYDKEHERSKRLRAYGIEKLIQCNHELCWRDAGESFAIRTKAAPGKGGDSALAKYVKKQLSLGWYSGLYANYCDLAPVNKYWDEDKVQRQPDNNWRPAWARNYALKPSCAIELEKELAPIIKKRYNPNSSYTDVHTCVAPWGYCDYDARVPGAGTFAGTFYAYGELLRNESNVIRGPVFSEGTYQWLYAGLADGNYGHVYNGINPSEQPLLPHFDLLKIHPLECDIGISWTSAYFAGKPGWDAPENLEHNIDRFIVAEIAYGHLGWLIEERYGMDKTCRSYYMMQQIQKRYALQAPKLIEYWDGKKFVSTSVALAKGIYRDSQLNIVYPNGLQIWINGSNEKNWLLSINSEEFKLPPAGWLARAPGFFEVSSLHNGKRIDAVFSSEYVWFDGRGVFTHYTWNRREIASKTGVAFRRLSPTRLEIIDINGSQKIGFRSPFGTAIMAVECDSFDISGKLLNPAEVKVSDNMNWIIGPDKGFRYVVNVREVESKERRR